jgi:hypothetical protein
MNHFKIIACTVAGSNTGYKFECLVKIQIDVKEWTAFKKRGALGVLYGIDVSNAVYALSNRLVPAHNPSVDDTQRAKNGIKTIRLSYYFDSADAAEKLGVKIKRNKAGEYLFTEWSSYADLLKPKLQLVTA